MCSTVCPENLLSTTLAVRVMLATVAATAIVPALRTCVRAELIDTVSHSRGNATFIYDDIMFNMVQTLQHDPLLYIMV